MNRLNPALPPSQRSLSIIENLLPGFCVRVRGSFFTRDHRGVIEQVDKTTSLLGKKDLLFSALDDGCGMHIIGFFEFLARDILELGFGDEGLSFGADEFLFQGDEFGGFWLFVLELLDLVLDLQSPLKLATLLSSHFRILEGHSPSASPA